jgi:hypothetical protein
MAVSDSLSLHTAGGFDLQDVLGAPAFGLAAVVITGIGTFNLFGINFGETLWSASSLEVSIALVVALFLLGLSWATNRAGDTWEDLDELESVAVGSGLVILLGMALVPAIREFVLASNATGTVAFILLSAAYTVTAWY